jgi:predicted ATPase
VGKTTLALHVATGAAGRFRDGAWLCELADIENETAVAEAVASTLGVRRQRDKTLLDSLINGFRDANALIVIDNCEHVRQPIARLVDTLATECSKLTLLATSREPLDLRRELCYLVNPLPVTRSASGEPGGPAVELFIERATESGAVLGPDDETTAAVADICQHLDGIPLAIELAASRTRAMSVTEMSVRLDERFRILDQHHQDRPHRHRTLWDIVDWSYQLLDPPTQRLFDRLSVFLGGFTTEAAKAIAGNPGNEVEDAIWTLVDRSMAQRSTGTDGSTRYHLLETLRQFGAQNLHQSDEEDATRALHLDHYTSMAVQADQAIRGPNEAPSVLQLNSEIANLRSAHQYALTIRDFDHAARLVTALHDYAMWRQFFELGSWAEATLELVSQPTSHHPALLATAGWGRCIAGDHEAAIGFATRGLEIEPTVQQSNGWLHDILAHCAYFKGDNDEGLAQADVEITRARAADDPYRLSYVLADSAVHAGLAGRDDIATPRAKEALALANRIGNPTAISMAQLTIGFITQADSPAEAISWLRASANLADTVQSHWTSAVCRGELALLLSLHGDPNEATQLLLDQFHTFRRAGDPGRVRNVILQAIPALHQLLGQEAQLDLVTLYHGSRNRPHIRIPLVDDAIADIFDQIQNDHGEAEVTAARARGDALPDTAIFDLASNLIEAAQETPAP